MIVYIYIDSLETLKKINTVVNLGVFVEFLTYDIKNESIHVEKSAKLTFAKLDTTKASLNMDEFQYIPDDKIEETYVRENFTKMSNSEFDELMSKLEDDINIQQLD